MFLFFRVYVGQWLTQVIFYFVLDSEYRLISFKTWICLLNICFLFCDGVCSTPANVLIMFLFNSFYLGNINKILIYIFKRALRDVTAKDGYHALESFCQNVRVVFWCLYICIYLCNHENNVPSRLSLPMALWELMHLGTWCTVKTWNRTSCAQVHEFPQSHCGDNREGTLLSWLHIYYAHLASVTFEHSACYGSLMTTYDQYIVYDVKFYVIMQSSGTMVILSSENKQKYISIKYRIS